MRRNFESKYLLLFLTVWFCGNSNAQETRTYHEILTGYSAQPNPRSKRGDMADTQKSDVAPKHGVVKYDIYRDRNPFPVDPRKPCQICIERQDLNARPNHRHDRIYGFQGRPYHDAEPGGCLCGKKKQSFKHTNVNVYWPSFLAGIPETIAPTRSAINASKGKRFRIANMFEHVAGFEVSGYQRRDNGYCGPGRDRYGCLGESRTIFSNVSGVGLRVPGQPVERGGVTYP